MTRGEFYDEKCDVFSFSMIMCELLLHRVNPFNRDYQFNIEYRIAIDATFRPILPHEIIREDCYENFILMMQQCWNHNPEARPSFDTIVTYLTNAVKKEVKRSGKKFSGLGISNLET